MKASLKNALPIIARYYCENLGMKVEFGASGAYHVPGLIGLPDLDDSVESSVMALGFIAHESAHEKFTDGLIVDHLPQGHPPFVKSLVNVLEDIRIEGLMFKQHPATVADLALVVRKVLGGGSGEVASKHDAALLHDGCLKIGRAKLLGQPLAEESQAHLQEFKSRFGIGRTTKILALLGKVPSLPDTKAVADLGYAILDVLDEEEPEDNQGNAPQDQSDPQGAQSTGGSQGADSSDGNTGDDGSSNAGSDPGTDGSGDQPGSDTSSPGQGDASPDGSQSGPDGDGGSGPGSGSGAGADGDGSGQSLKQKVLAAGGDVLDDLISDLGDEVAKRMGSMKSSAGKATPATVRAEPSGSSMLGAEVVAAGQAASVGLRQVLMGLIQGSQNSRVETRRQGRSIDGKRIAQVRVGENRIFRKQAPVQNVNAAFQILLDGSTSMEGLSMRRAEEATVAVLAALETIPHVSTGAMVFPRKINHKTAVGVLKRHNQPLRVAVAEKRFGIVAEGGTPLAEAIWPAAGDLLQAKGERKVMMVVTDGDPNDEDQAREMVQRCKASGIEVFAIAFGKVKVDKLNAVYGKHWKYLESTDQLRNALYEVVRNVLTQKAA